MIESCLMAWLAIPFVLAFSLIYMNLCREDIFPSPLKIFKNGVNMFSKFKKLKRKMVKEELRDKCCGWVRRGFPPTVPAPKTNYEKATDLKNEYKEIKQRVIKAETKMNEFKKKAKSELEWILKDE